MGVGVLLQNVFEEKRGGKEEPANIKYQTAFPCNQSDLHDFSFPGILNKAVKRKQGAREAEKRNTLQAVETSQETNGAHIY